MKRWWVILSLLVMGSQRVKACDCGGTLPDWSTHEVLLHDVVFLAKVDSVVSGKWDCTAFFSGLTLFKGVMSQKTAIRFDCVSSCAIPLAPGEVWLVYGMRPKEGSSAVQIDYCGRTRPWVAEGAPDEYAVFSRMHFQQELKKLQDAFPAQHWARPEEVEAVAQGKKIVLDGRRDLQHATRPQMAWLLGISAAAMLVIWLLLKKWLKPGH